MRFLFAFILSFSFICNVYADERLPQIPTPIQGLVDQGAQIRYLGERYGMDSWITILRGQEQYFYVLPGGEAFVMGLLYDAEGKVVTTQQLRDLQEAGDNFLDIIDPPQKTASVTDKPLTYKKPAERMYEELENANWVSFGVKGAPIIYSFIDPQCPHCHAFLTDIRKGYVEAGKIEVRAIPVGYTPETLAQAALLLASSSPQERFYSYLDGDEDALPIRDDVNNQGVQRNMAIMQSWKFDITPLTVYRAKNGEIKLVRGRVNDMESIMQDLL